VRRTLIALVFASPLALAQQPPQQGQMPAMPDLEQMFFQQFDTNQDGVVSKQEFLKPTEAQFDHMDKDGNGNLDRNEVKAFNEEMERRMQEMQRQMQQQGMPQR
jgi:Ca2+-binding EF-hand superfamily protein